MFCLYSFEKSQLCAKHWSEIWSNLNMLIDSWCVSKHVHWNPVNSFLPDNELCISHLVTVPFIIFSLVHFFLKLSRFRYCYYFNNNKIMLSSWLLLNRITFFFFGFLTFLFYLFIFGGKVTHTVLVAIVIILVNKVSILNTSLHQPNRSKKNLLASLQMYVNLGICDLVATLILQSIILLTPNWTLTPNVLTLW